MIIAPSIIYDSINVEWDSVPEAKSLKISELKDQGWTEAEINNYFTFSPLIELEIFYHKDCGMFAVESEAVESGCELHSPYGEESIVTEEEFEDFIEEWGQTPEEIKNALEESLDEDVDDQFIINTGNYIWLESHGVWITDSIESRQHPMYKAFFP